MLDFLTRGVTKIFGTKSDRDIRELTPYVGKVNAESSRLQPLTDDQLRGKTAEIKLAIQQSLQNIDDQLAALQKRIAEEQGLDVTEKEEIFNQIDQLEKERNKGLEVVLLEVLPAAFAVVKETARRFKENGRLEVEATLFDKKLSATKQNVQIEGDRAIWHNRWLAAGTEITRDMVH